MSLELWLGQEGKDTPTAVCVLPSGWSGVFVRVCHVHVGWDTQGKVACAQARIHMTRYMFFFLLLPECARHVPSFISSSLFIPPFLSTYFVSYTTANPPMIHAAVMIALHALRLLPFDCCCTFPSDPPAPACSPDEVAVPMPPPLLPLECGSLNGMISPQATRVLLLWITTDRPLIVAASPENRS